MITVLNSWCTDIPGWYRPSACLFRLLHCTVPPFHLPHAQVRTGHLGARRCGGQALVQRLASPRRCHVCQLRRRPCKSRSHLFSYCLIAKPTFLPIFQIRSVYRTIELSQGFDGFLTRTEVYFYALDFVPLLLALAIYIVFWPGRFIPPSSPGGLVGDGEKNSNSHEGTLRDVELSETKA